MKDERHSLSFHYDACAHAFGAQFTRPFHHLIEVQAPSSLPVTGGHGHSRVENFQFSEFISFKKAYTHVSGALQEEDDSNNTLATATVEGLNILDILTADRVVARLYSKHPHGAAEGRITMHGSRYENLRIAGCKIEAELDFELFDKIKTFEDAQTEFAKDGKFTRMVQAMVPAGQALKPKDPSGAFLCGAVNELKVDCPGLTPLAHGFYVPGFGKVYLAEVLMCHGTRTLTMFRLELGSSISASGVVTSATTNGKNWPP